jgi:hypothetical protein
MRQYSEVRSRNLFASVKSTFRSVWQTNCRTHRDHKNTRGRTISLVSCVQLAGGWLRKEREHPKELDLSALLCLWKSCAAGN